MDVELAAGAVAIVRAFYQRELTKTSDEGADRVAAAVLDVVELVVRNDPPTRGALQSLRSNPDDGPAQQLLLGRLTQAAAMYPDYRRALEVAVRGTTPTPGEAVEPVAPQPKSWLANILGESSAPRWTVIAGVMAVLVPLVSLITWLASRVIEQAKQATPPNPSPTQSSSTGASSGAMALEAARSKCAPSENSVRIGDGGHTLVIDRAVAKENPGIDINTLACILDELDVPDSVVSHIEATTSLSGIQKANFNGYSAFWTYHPDRGLHLTISQNRS
ncbi:MAG TPA: hypothetical protein VF062_06425 [Candidatus Limnocylindrales bacterium]